MEYMVELINNLLPLFPYFPLEVPQPMWRQVNWSVWLQPVQLLLLVWTVWYPLVLQSWPPCLLCLSCLLCSLCLCRLLLGLEHLSVVAILLAVRIFLLRDVPFPLKNSSGKLKLQENYSSLYNHLLLFFAVLTERIE